MRCCLILVLLAIAGCTSDVSMYPPSWYSGDDDAGGWSRPRSHSFDHKEAFSSLYPALARKAFTVVAYTELPGACAASIVRIASPENTREGSYRLLLTREASKLFELNLGETTYEDYYALTTIQSKSEDNPLLLVFKDDGGTTRNFEYRLYRLENNRLRCIWNRTGDGYTISTTHWRSLSNIDFSGLISGRMNHINVAWNGTTKLTNDLK